MLELCVERRRAYIMVSTLDSRASGPGLAGNIVLCSWASPFTLTVPLSTQVYKWVPANCWGILTDCGGVTCDGSGQGFTLFSHCECRRIFALYEGKWNENS